MSHAPSQLTVPPGFPELLQGLAREVLRNQPQDIVVFAHEHFSKMVNDRAAEAQLSKAVEVEKETTVLTPNADAIVPEPVAVPEQPKQPTESSAPAEEPEEELPKLDSFTDQEVAAVTTIQSTFRGFKARKVIKEDLEEANKAVEENQEELPDIEKFTPDEVQKITKLQAEIRGFQVRKQARAKTAAEAPATEQAVPEIEAQEDEELPDVNEFTDDEVQKIIKLQAEIRGFQARKQVKAKKDDEAVIEAVVTEPVEVKESAENEEEELPALDSFNKDEVEAITKIQSSFRGFAARKKVSNDKLPTVEDPNAAAGEDLSIQRPETAQTNAEDVVLPDTARTETN